MLDSLIGLVKDNQGLVAIIAGCWAILTFIRNNRIKAAEILIRIEKEYYLHVETWMKIEFESDYQEYYSQALKKAIGDSSDPYTPEEDKEIANIEKALQLLFVCLNVRRLGVDSGAINRLCSYHLRLIVKRDEQDPSQYVRPELNQYVRRYWKTVYDWAETVGYPWPKRIGKVIRRWPSQLRYWWNGRIDDSRKK